MSSDTELHRWFGRRRMPAESGCQPETWSDSGDGDGYPVTSKAKAERALDDQLRTDLTPESASDEDFEFRMARRSRGPRGRRSREQIAGR